jgi:hypothetical protein
MPISYQVHICSFGVIFGSALPCHKFDFKLVPVLAYLQYIWTPMQIPCTAAMSHSYLALATIAALHTNYKLAKFQHRMPHSSRDAIFQISACLGLWAIVMDTYENS